MKKDIPVDELIIKKEGNISFYSFPPENYSKGKALNKSMPVFYNPIQELNRSFSLIAFRTFYLQKKNEFIDYTFKICDSMAASGIRSLRLIRYFDEDNQKKDDIKFLEIIVNDLNPLAIEFAKRNYSINNINNSTKIIYFNEDANYLFNYMRKEKIIPAIIDIDPFGSPNVYIENALRSLHPTGMLAVTATDTAVFFGIRSKACIRKYNSKPLRSSFLKEIGLRIMLYFLASRAHTLKKGIRPLMSLSFDHYIRLFVQIIPGKSIINNNIDNFGYVLWCKNCDWRTSIYLNIKKFKTTCPECRAILDYGGPLWLGKLHDQEFISNNLNHLKKTNKKEIPSLKKIQKILEIIINEDRYPVGYFEIHKLCDLLNVSVSSLQKIFNAIELKGYNANRTHITPKGIKSDIPLSSLKNILNELSKE